VPDHVFLEARVEGADVRFGITDPFGRRQAAREWSLVPARPMHDLLRPGGRCQRQGRAGSRGGGQEISPSKHAALLLSWSHFRRVGRQRATKAERDEVLASGIELSLRERSHHRSNSNGAPAKGKPQLKLARGRFALS